MISFFFSFQLTWLWLDRVVCFFPFLSKLGPTELLVPCFSTSMLRSAFILSNLKDE